MKNNMNPGDRVKINTKESSFEGVLLPRPDLLNEGIIVLKLDTGYNIGIKKSNIDNLLLIKSVTSVKKEVENLKFDSKLPTVAILSLGGTISSSIDYSSGGVKAVDYTANDFVSMCPQIKDFANIKTKSLFQIMSEDIDLRQISEISKKIKPWIDDDTIDGIVVTIGTDCFHYVTSALTFMVKTNKPIIFTASQRSIDRGSSDAFMNLTCAVFAAAKWDGAEIVSCMHANSDDDSCLLIRGNKVRKMHTSRRDAFRPINILPYTKISYPDLKFEKILDSYVKKKDVSKEEVKVNYKLSKDVALIHVHPGINPNVIDFYIKEGVKGIVLAGTALGHVPTNGDSNLLPVIKKALDKKIIVVVATQTLYGRTHPYVYTNLRKLTVQLDCIFAEDMLPETAYMKLSWLIANFENKEEIKNKFKENLAGEINPILDAESYLY